MHAVSTWYGTWLDKGTREYAVYNACLFLTWHVGVPEFPSLGFRNGYQTDVPQVHQRTFEVTLCGDDHERMLPLADL